MKDADRDREQGIGDKGEKRECERGIFMHLLLV